MLSRLTEAALARKFKHLKGLKCHYTFRIGAEIGEGGQSGGEEETRRRRRWVETRLAEVATLDCLGSELEEGTLQEMRKAILPKDQVRE